MMMNKSDAYFIDTRHISFVTKKTLYKKTYQGKPVPLKYFTKISPIIETANYEVIRCFIKTSYIGFGIFFIHFTESKKQNYNLLSCFHHGQAPEIREDELLIIKDNDRGKKFEILACGTKKNQIINILGIEIYGYRNLRMLLEEYE